MALTPGTRFGPYEVAALIGVGGMGEVYRATDTNLKRQVALKVLPAEVANDPDRLARFQREAEILAALNHPNIAHIHGLETAGATFALVMELVEGQTLADRIAAGAIPLDEALPIAMQITQALEAAHEQGIIHRDLKPANVKVCDDGTVKVLDFGLAKALNPAAAIGASASGSPTITSPAVTGAGVILGTAVYMSPEQAKGRAVDKRSDIWAFGCVLYEMLTGKRVFDGEDTSETIAVILKGTPDWSALPADTPPHIVRLLRRCLEKDIRERLRDIADARFDMHDALAAPAVAVPRRGRERVAWLLFAVALLAAAGLGVVAYLRTPAADTFALRAAIAIPANVRMVASSANRFAISPDGRRLAFVAAASPDGRPMLWVRPLDGLVSQPLSGTEGADAPFWSPNSRLLGFFNAGKLKTIDAAGGPSSTVCEYPARSAAIGATWNRDNVILFSVAAGQGGIQRVSAAGGTPSAITTPDKSKGELGHVRPFFLPDGRHFLYMALAPPSAGVMRSLGIHVASLDSREPTLLVADGQTASYAQGHLLFLRETTLMAQALDLDRLELMGAAAPVAEQVQNSTGNGGPGLNGAFSVSETGTLVYQAGATEGNRRLVWFDRTGRQVGVLGEPGDYRDVEISPDGKRVAVSILDRTTQSPDIWLFDVARGVSSRLTFDPAVDVAPIWSPDGSQIVFLSRRGGGQNLFSTASNRAGDEVAILTDDTLKIPTSWSPDGRFVLYTARSGPTRSPELWVLPLFGDRKPFPLHHATIRGLSGRFSPDGRWVAYSSAESGRPEVYVTPFPGPGGRFQISPASGGPPRWGRDGREIFFSSVDGKLMVASISFRESNVDVGIVKEVSAAFPTAAASEQAFDVSADGDRALINTIAEDPRAAPLTLVVNWLAGLRK